MGLKQLAAAFLALCAINTVAADDAFTHRIVGGEQATEGAWPSIAALVFNFDASLFNRQFCAGNVIHEKWILTAAHCLFELKAGGTAVALEPREFRVALGITDLNDPTSATEVAVEAYEVHPYYNPLNPASYYDIAVIELAEPTSTPVMELYNGDSQAQGGSAAVVIGWGASDYGTPSAPVFPSVLQQVTVPMVTRDVCNLPASYNGILREGQLCAGYPEGGKDSCVGDSGGPIMLLQAGSYRQIGVVSFGDGCALPDKYGVYSDVPYFSNWIAQYTSGQVTPGNGTGGISPPWENSADSSQSGAVSWFALLLALLACCQRIYLSPRKSART